MLEGPENLTQRLSSGILKDGRNGILVEPLSPIFVVLFACVMNPRIECGGLQVGFQLGRLLQARDMTRLSQGILSGYNQTSHRAPLLTK